MTLYRAALPKLCYVPYLSSGYKAPLCPLVFTSGLLPPTSSLLLSSFAVLFAILIDWAACLALLAANMFSGRKFSINRHTGAPKPLLRRFSNAEPSTNG